MSMSAATPPDPATGTPEEFAEAYALVEAADRRLYDHKRRRNDGHPHISLVEDV